MVPKSIKAFSFTVTDLEDLHAKQNEDFRTYTFIYCYPNKFKQCVNCY